MRRDGFPLSSKKTRKASFRAFLWILLFRSGVADLVDVTGEVEHLVGEAPFIGIAFGASLKTTDLQSLLYSGFYAKSLLHL